MTSTYVNNLRLNEMGTGDASGTWGTITNTNLTLIADAFGYQSKTVASASTDTLTIPDGTETNNEAISLYIKLSGGDQACTITIGPNTVKKLWIIENATSYTMTLTQGSGANVILASGVTKMIYADGAGSGAALTDALASLEVGANFYIKNAATGDNSTATLHLQTAEADIEADDVIGKINFQAPNEGTGTDAILVAAGIQAVSEGDFSSTNNATSLKFITGNSAAAGTDGGSLILGSTGNLTLKDLRTADGSSPTVTLQSGDTDIAANDVLGTINFQAPDEGTGTDAILVAAGIAAISEGDFSSTNNATKLSFKTAASDTAAETMALSSAGNLTCAGTFVPTGAITANAGVVVDEMTLDGDTLTATDTFKIDSVDDIFLDPDTGIVRFQDSGTTKATTDVSSSHLTITNSTNDHDIIFKGYDSNSLITALTLDMSEAGAATFNSGITLGSSLTASGAPFTISNTSNGNNIDIKTTSSSSLVHSIKIHSGGVFEAKQGAVFNEDSNDVDFRVESDGQANMLLVDAGNNAVLINNSSRNGSEQFHVTGLCYIDTTQGTGYGAASNSGSIVFGATNYTAVNANAVVQQRMYGGGDAAGQRISIKYRTRDSDTLGSETEGAYCTGTAWTDSSDIAYKDDIVNIPYGLETIQKLIPRKWKWNTTNKDDIGFVAQEIEKEIPEVVTGEDGQKGLHYGALVAVCVKAIQELEARIKLLEGK